MGLKYWALMSLLLMAIGSGLTTIALLFLVSNDNEINPLFLGAGMIITIVLSVSCLWCQQYAKPADVLAIIKTRNKISKL